MGIFQNNLLAASAAAASAGGGGFYSHQIEQSARFDSASSSYLTKTFSGAGNRRTGSVSVWVKRSTLSTQQQLFGGHVSNGDQDQLLSFNSSSSADHADSMSQWWDGANNGDETTKALFRDISGWNHFLLAWDTTQGTDTNRVKLYLNGSQITSFESYNGGTVSYPSQDLQTFTFSNCRHNIASRQASGPGNFFDGYLAEFIAIDGTQIAPTDVGESKNGVWIPKQYTGSFGTNGVHLKFENSSDLGNDSSGNNNDYTSGNMGTDHQVLDSPTFGS